MKTLFVVIVAACALAGCKGLYTLYYYPSANDPFPQVVEGYLTESGCQQDALDIAVKSHGKIRASCSRN